MPMGKPFKSGGIVDLSSLLWICRLNLWRIEMFELRTSAEAVTVDGIERVEAEGNATSEDECLNS